MTATLAEVREAIKGKLQEVAGLDTVYGYHNGSPTPPCAIVGWPETHDLATRLGDVTAWENRSLILFKHKEHKHLVQCSVLIDVMRNPRVVTACYELR